MLRPVILAVLLMASPVLADITGPARIIDGDTIVIAGERIRFHGIDAPESGQTCVAGGERWRCGQRATDALRNKVGDRQVTCEELDRDRYERIVARCMVDDEDLGEWMVLRGWAVAYVYYSYEYTRAEATAKSRERGIWASDFEMPWDWRKMMRGNDAQGATE